jgi:prepilin peptidase CpaA
MTELGFNYTEFAAAVLGFVLLFATTTDVLAHRIPNALLAPALAIAVLAAVAATGISGLLSVCAGLAVGMLMLFPLYVAGGTSAGDVKLLGVAGAFLGPTGALFAGLFTFIAGAALGLVWIAFQRFLPLLQCRLAESSIPLFASMAMNGTSNGDKPRSFAYAPAIMIGSMTSAWYGGWQFLGI